MTTESYLTQLGVKIEEARSFIINNVNNPQLVFDTCKAYSVNNDMIAEILQNDFPGVTGSVVSDFFDMNGCLGSELGFDTSNLPNEYDSLNLGLGFSVFAEKKQDNIDYSYVKENNNTLIQTDNHKNVEKDIYDGNGRLLKNIELDEDGNIDCSHEFTYNEQNQIVRCDSIYYKDGVQVAEGLTLNVWNDTGLTSTTETTYYGYGTFYSNAIGESLNSTKTDPLVWKMDIDSNGTIDYIDYFNYDNNGNEINVEKDTNADGVIDQEYSTEWLLIV